MSSPIAPGTARPQVPSLQKADPELVKAAQGMEAMFLDYLMNVMRQSVPESDLDLENSATKIYRSMLDSHLAETASHVGGVGLSDLIVEYMQAGRYNQKGEQSPQDAQIPTRMRSEP